MTKIMFYDLKIKLSLDETKHIDKCGPTFQAVTDDSPTFTPRQSVWVS